MYLCIFSACFLARVPFVGSASWVRFHKAASKAAGQLTAVIAVKCLDATFSAQLTPVH